MMGCGGIQTGQWSIVEEIKEQMWGWIGHTLRRRDGHLAKTAIEWKLQGKCKRERERETATHLEAQKDVRT